VIRNPKKIWIHVFSLGICLFLSQELWAAPSFTVRKVQGKKALIEYTGPHLEAGNTYTIGETQQANTGRERFASIRELVFSNITQTVGTLSGRTSTFSAVGSYGWNLGHFEYGPVFGLGSVDAGNGGTTTFTLGGIFDYNFQANNSENRSVWGLGTEVLYTKASNPSASDSPATTSLFLSGVWKWFFINSVCIRIDGGYKYSKTSSTTESTQSGIIIQGGFSVYF